MCVYGTQILSFAVSLWSVTFVVVQIVPENRDPLEVADESPSKLAASEVTIMLQQGKDEDACEKLADDLCKVVTDNVKTSNKEMSKLANGSKCKNEGQYEVEKSRQEVNKWETKLKTRTSRATKLANARVKWTYTLNTLTQGQCDQFFQDPAYVKAKTASKNAADLVIKAQSQVTTLTKQWNEHIVRAAVKRTKCECDVRAEYNSAYRAATKNAEQNAKAYAKCKHMKCFLKTGNSEKCMNITFDVPTVNRKKKFAQGVPEKECKGTSSTSTQPVQRGEIQPVTTEVTCYADGPGTTVVPCSPSTSTTTTTESTTTLGSETESDSETESGPMICMSVSQGVTESDELCNKLCPNALLSNSESVDVLSEQVVRADVIVSDYWKAHPVKACRETKFANYCECGDSAYWEQFAQYQIKNGRVVMKSAKQQEEEYACSVSLKFRSGTLKEYASKYGTPAEC